MDVDSLGTGLFSYHSTPCLWHMTRRSGMLAKQTGPQARMLKRFSLPDPNCLYSCCFYALSRSFVWSALRVWCAQPSYVKCRDHSSSELLNISTCMLNNITAEEVFPNTDFAVRLWTTYEVFMSYILKTDI